MRSTAELASVSCWRGVSKATIGFRDTVFIAGISNEGIEDGCGAMTAAIAPVRSIRRRYRRFGVSGPEIAALALTSMPQWAQPR
jgi:hypothetical protein